MAVSIVLAAFGNYGIPTKVKELIDNGTPGSVGTTVENRAYVSPDEFKSAMSLTAATRSSARGALKADLAKIASSPGWDGRFYYMGHSWKGGRSFKVGDHDEPSGTLVYPTGGDMAAFMADILPGSTSPIHFIIFACWIGDMSSDRSTGGETLLYSLLTSWGKLRPSQQLIAHATKFETWYWGGWNMATVSGARAGEDLPSLIKQCLPKGLNTQADLQVLLNYIKAKGLTGRYNPDVVKEVFNKTKGFKQYSDVLQQTYVSTSQKYAAAGQTVRKSVFTSFYIDPKYPQYLSRDKGNVQTTVAGKTTTQRIIERVDPNTGDEIPSLTVYC